MANISISKKTETRNIAKIVVNGDEYLSAQESALKKLAQKIKMPGFRKGKVPHHIIKSKFASDFESETLNNCLEKNFSDIVESAEHGFYQVVAIDNLKKKSDGVVFDLVFDSNSYAKFGKIKTVSYVKDICVITDSDIDEKLESIKKQYASFKEKENKTVEQGDRVTLSFEVWLNDAPQGEAQENQEFFIGDKSLDEEVEKKLLEKPSVLDDEVSVSKKLSESEIEGIKKQNPDASEVDHYDLVAQVKKIEAVELAELSEETIAKVNPDLETVDDLKNYIKENLEKQFFRKNAELEAEKAISELLKISEIFYPENYLDSKVNEYLKQQKITEELSKENREEMKKQMKAQHDRKILVEQMIAEVVDNPPKNSPMKGLSYREQLYEFLKKEFNDSMADMIIIAYDNMVDGKKSADAGNYFLENSLGQFHQSLVVAFFEANNCIKKGNKVPVKEMLARHNHTHAHHEH